MSRTEVRTPAVWDRARLSALVPIGLIVLVALICIVVAVVTSARFADQVAIQHAEELFGNALAARSERMLQELQGAVTMDEAQVRLRRGDVDWIDHRLAPVLKDQFGHDYVFVVDASDRMIYPRTIDPTWLERIRPDLGPILGYLRGRLRPEVAAYLRPEPNRLSRPHTDPRRDGRVQSFSSSLAVVVGLLVAPPGANAAEIAESTPIVVSVKLVDEGMLADIATRLDLPNLHGVGAAPVAPDDHSFALTDDRGNVVARFAWAPKQRWRDVVTSLVPFITVALGALLFFAGLALRHMRRAAATISEGENQLRYLAMHDPLSGLPNRAYFSERLEAMITEVEEGGSPSAFFYIDLDHFKDVNDSLGHNVGDELIAAVTRRLRRIIRDEALVARLGGDEFAVITRGATDSETLMAIADRILLTLCHPYAIQTHTIVIGASIGIAVIDRSSLTAADVMRYADMALYRAKNEGRRRACVYDAVMDADLVQRKQLEHDLRQAIETEGLHLAYQPVFSADATRVVGVEALARWDHPMRGAIPPVEFIPIAEHSGLILALGEWALRRACLDTIAWPISVAVNVSPLQFRRPDFVEVVERILTETGFEPGRLELEITESTLLGNVEGAENAMQRLKQLGVHLALDDFGTGYSSLLYLRRFPFDKLKIDRSFIRNIESAAEAAPIVHAIVSLGRGLGMKVTAEGVETAEQHLFLRAAGVHFMQGYRFGEPEVASGISKRLALQARRELKLVKPVAQAV